MFTIGADPEVFISTQEGKIVSAIGLIGGTKEHPKRVSDTISVQEDNVLAEFNIPPARSKAEFVYSISQGLNEIHNIVKVHTYRPVYIASHIMDDDQLTDSRALVFGCDPDMNAWTLMYNDPPDQTTKIRSAGGHVHVGGIEENEVIKVVRAMDLFLGVPSVLLDRDNRRRMLYGKAGCFRPKEYGLEYRTLSNFWLQSQTLCEWVYDNTIKAINWSRENEFIEDESQLALEIIEAINNSDKEIASKILEKYVTIELPEAIGD